MDIFYTLGTWGAEGMQPATVSQLFLLLVFFQDHTAQSQTGSLFSGSLLLNIL